MCSLEIFDSQRSMLIPRSFTYRRIVGFAVRVVLIKQVGV